MGFINDIINTVINTGKNAIKDEVKEQTENAIESVSKKVTDTVKDAGNKVENTVKEVIENPKEVEQSKVEVANVTNSVNPSTNSLDEILKTDPENSIAPDVANILEKVVGIEKSETARNASAFEGGIVSEINKATDMLNEAYGKDTTKNDDATSITEAFEHLVKATKNVGSDTNNDAGKLINKIVEDGSNTNYNKDELAMAQKQTEDFVNKFQQEVDNYKNVDE